MLEINFIDLENLEERDTWKRVGTLKIIIKII